jgi:hypothetical protein
MATKRRHDTNHVVDRAPEVLSHVSASAASSSAAPSLTLAMAGARAATAIATASPVLLGRLLLGSTTTTPLVDFAGNATGPLRARTTMVLDGATIERAVVTNQPATLVFENGDPQRPIVTGLVQTGQAVTPFQGLLVSAKPTARGTRTGKAPIEARLDGERVVLEGKKEVMLKCGEASITLRSDGKMVLRGTYVETYAKGLNRIKGASVKIN